MDAVALLQQVPLFASLSEGDLRRICQDAATVGLRSGELLFSEGDAGDHAYVVIDGSVEVIKATGGREALVALRGAGSVVGEMSLLQEEPRMASVRARTDVQLLSISRSSLDRLLGSSPSAARALIRTLLDRMRETSERLRQSERMAQLGTLTAGVAHELNNPAAAVRRAAERLGEELAGHAELVARRPPEGDDGPRRRALAVAAAATRPPAQLDPLTRSDAEAEMEAALGAHDVEDAWQLAPDLVGAGFTTEDLRHIADEGASEALADALRFVVTWSLLRDLAAEVGAGAQRLSDIVGALKGYSYLDRAPVQDVDVTRGLEDTLLLLGHRLDGVRVEREFAPDLPRITAFGSELNQVWSNLIDNALDALAEVSDREPVLTLRARGSEDEVVVEVEDNGPGIPDELRPRIFDAFVTTKPPGHGTGLGLQISYRIVALEHRGELTVDSEPGRTVFRAVLPQQLPAGAEPSVVTDAQPADRQG